GEHEARLLVSDEHHRFEAAQIAVHAPILGELDAGARELTRVLLELRFEPFEQREGVGGGAGEARDHLALAEPPNLLGVALHDGLAEADLAIASDDGFAALLHHDDRRRAPDVATLFFFAVHSALDDGVLWEHLRISPHRGKCRPRSAANPPATVLADPLDYPFLRHSIRHITDRFASSPRGRKVAPRHAIEALLLAAKEGALPTMCLSFAASVNAGLSLAVI